MLHRKILMHCNGFESVGQPFDFKLDRFQKISRTSYNDSTQTIAIG
jgi:hypothetical protein